jgi:2',3'-cyclic-nucleotide 2'-phosphodiesterase (5'-nucleotidase family)
MDKVWSEDKPLLNLDAGDVFGQRTQNEREQTKFLCQELANLGLDAIGLGEQDLNYGLDFLREMMDTNKLPFICANVKDAKTGKLILPAYKVVERNGVKYAIVGIFDPQQPVQTLTGGESPVTVDDPLATLRELVPQLRREADSVILLSHLGETGTEALLKELQGVDICIIGHSFRNLETERVINDTAVFGSAYEGRFIGRADLFVEEKTGRVMAIDVGITDFDDKAPEDAEVLARVTKFKADLETFKEAKRAAYPRINGSEKEQFVGDRTCFNCHEAAWQSYASSAHRRAYASLRGDGQSSEPDCLVCHTTGYQWKNGYSDERPNNSLVNVQCEACHGYGTMHARDGKWRLEARASCTTCHDKANSPNFDYATYWEKIKH